MELRTREKAALEFSGFCTIKQFREEERISEFNFLALPSLRVLVRKIKNAGEANAGHGSASELSAGACQMMGIYSSLLEQPC